VTCQGFTITSDDASGSFFSLVSASECRQLLGIEVSNFRAARSSCNRQSLAVMPGFPNRKRLSNWKRRRGLTSNPLTQVGWIARWK